MQLRSIALLSLVSLLVVAAPAAAQEAVPPPPGGYVVTVALDDVVLPLVAAAEQDAAQGRPALAVARAQVALEALPPSSPLRVRAEGVRLVAQQSLGAAAAEPVAPETLVEPLVVQAELDGQRGMHALSIARLDFALARVPPASPLAQRAQALRQAASRMMIAGQATTPPTTTTPQVVQAAPGVTPYGYAPAAPVAAVDGERPGAVPAQTEPEDPTRRGDGEAIELYITAAAYGVYLGFWIPFAAGLESNDSGDGSPENLVYSLTMLAGGGLMALLVAGLDSGDGLRTGVGPSISMGIRYGLGAGFLMWGALDPVLSDTSRSSDPFCDPVSTFCPTVENRAGWAERTGLPMGFGLGGALLGAVIGYGLQPSTDDVRFVETGGIWGTGLGLLAAIAAAQDSSQGFGITATGLGLGLLTNAIIAGLTDDITPRRSWLMTLGFVIGAAAGTLVPALAAAGTGDFDVRIFGAVAAATSIAGLVTAFVLTEGMDDRIRERDRARREGRAAFDPLRDMRLGAGPTEGGGVLTLSGQF